MIQTRTPTGGRIPGKCDGALMRDTDWAATPLGIRDTWPDRPEDAAGHASHLALRDVAAAGATDSAFFYNDAYVPTLGSSIPRPWAALSARSGRRSTPTSPIGRMVRSGEATWNKALLLLLERNGYPEETYHSFSYSPLHDGDGMVRGLMCVVTEETERVISDAASRPCGGWACLVGAVTTAEAVCKASRPALAAHTEDFALRRWPMSATRR